MTEPAPPQPRPKRQHYLPQSYLKAWADEKHQVAARRRDKAEAFPVSIRNIAIEADLYSIPSEDGPDDALEVAFSRVEQDLPALLAQLREHNVPKKTAPARRQISHLLALQRARTPEHLDQWLFPIKAAEFTNERPMSYDGMRRFLTEVHLGVRPVDSEVAAACDFANYVLTKGPPTKQQLLTMMIEIAERKITPHLAEMAWSVETSPRRAFITSDRPLVEWTARPPRHQGVGLGNAQEVWFPLGPHDLLVLRPRYPEHCIVVDPGRALQVNRRLAASCYRLVIGRPADRTELEHLTMRSTRPAIRFNTGPLMQQAPDGHLVPTGEDILHMYTPHDDTV